MHFDGIHLNRLEYDMSSKQHDEELTRSIDLPEVDWLTAPQERDNGGSSAYGATAVAAAYCGFRIAPSPIPGLWAHGWIPSYRKKLHPALILGMRTDLESRFWVAREDQEQYLRDYGYANVTAIGLPIV